MMPSQTAHVFNSELRIATDHPAFPGHFPGFPLLPGAALLDEALREIARARGIDLIQWRVASAKFLKIVRPGSTLSLQHTAPNASTIRFTVLLGADTVATGTLSDIAAVLPGNHGA